MFTNKSSLIVVFGIILTSVWVLLTMANTYVQSLTIVPNLLGFAINNVQELQLYFKMLVLGSIVGFISILFLKGIQTSYDSFINSMVHGLMLGIILGVACLYSARSGDMFTLGFIMGFMITLPAYFISMIITILDFLKEKVLDVSYFLSNFSESVVIKKEDQSVSG